MTGKQTPLVCILCHQLQRQAKDSGDTPHGLVFPAHSSAAIRVAVPEARCGGVQASPCIGQQAALFA